MPEENEPQRVNRELIELLNELRVALPGVQVATTLLIAPSPLHRLNFRHHDKLAIVLTSNQLLLAGLGVLGLALTGVMMLISSVVFGGATAIIVPLIASVLLLVFWVGLPLRARRGEDLLKGDGPR